MIFAKKLHRRRFGSEYASGDLACWTKSQKPFFYAKKVSVFQRKDKWVNNYDINCFVKFLTLKCCLLSSQEAYKLDRSKKVLYQVYSA